jgi:hypothetical protein
LPFKTKGILILISAGLGRWTGTVSGGPGVRWSGDELNRVFRDRARDGAAYSHVVAKFTVFQLEPGCIDYLCERFVRKGLDHQGRIILKAIPFKKRLFTACPFPRPSSHFSFARSRWGNANLGADSGSADAEEDAMPEGSRKLAGDGELA